MAETVLLATGVTVVWGASAITSPQGGEVKSYREAASSAEKRMPGAAGTTKALVKYDKVKKGTLEVYCASDTAAPDVGDVLAVGGIAAGVVDSASVVWQSEDFKLLSIECSEYEGLQAAGGGE